MKFFLTFTTLLVLVSVCIAENHLLAPEEIIQNTTRKVLDRVKRDKEVLQENPGEMFRLVSDLIFPHFDFAVMSRFVMGSEWKSLPEDKRQAFVDQFRKLLVRTYATALLEFSDQEIEYVRSEIKAGASTAKIFQEIKNEGGTPMIISYRLHNRNIDWKVFDVTVSGVSLVKTYRASFQSIIESKGVAGLIASLKEKNKKYGNL